MLIASCILQSMTPGCPKQVVSAEISSTVTEQTVWLQNRVMSKPCPIAHSIVYTVLNTQDPRGHKEYVCLQPLIRATGPLLPKLYACTATLQRNALPSTCGYAIQIFYVLT